MTGPSGGHGVRDVRTARDATGTVVLVPAAVDRDLVLVAARGKRERARVDAVGPLGERRRGAVRLPVARAAHLAVVAAGDRHVQVARSGGRHDAVDRVADARERGRRARVAGRVDGDRAVLDQRTGREAADVGVHARGRRLRRAQGRPGVVAEDPVGERGLAPDVRGHVGGDRDEARQAGARRPGR